MIVAIIQNLCDQHNIQNSSITVACDGLEAIYKAMSDDTNYSCQSNQFNLISAIDSMIRDSSIEWKWRRVKGHQDKKFIGLLDR
eukprot:3373620-Ditylum_brightwellii.AAC.3